MPRRLLSLVLLLLSLTAWAVTSGASVAGAAQARAAGPLKVAASFSIIADMAREVGGERIALTCLVGPDADTHVYEPTPADAKALAQADLILVNGLGFEGWMDRLVKSSGTKAAVAVLSAGVKPRTMVDEDHGGKKVQDPHAWQDLANGRLYVANLAKALAKADPEGAAFYQERAEAYRKRLADLDAWVRGQFAAIPKAARTMITSHDALGYFGQAYGVKLLSPVGVSTEAEPSAKAVGQLIRQIKKEKITALFVENINDPRMIERIAQDSGVRPGGRLYSDALSGPDGPAGTYENMFRSNVEMIAKAMAPAR
jgi:zinc/manganese transport system substrate-binding protein